MNNFENSKKNLILFIILLFFLMSLNFILNWRIIKPQVKISLQDSKVSINKDLIDIISFGNRRFLSSIYWTETLLDSDLKHYKNKDLNNWMYHRFDTITTLDPNFYQAYLFGGIYLSIVKDDERGAKKIYEKGLTHFPEDLDLLYNAGFNDYFELDLPEDAIKKFEKITQDPKGFKKYPFIISLLQRMKVQKGFSLEEIYSILFQKFQRTKENTFVWAQYRKNLYGLKAEIDLECLNGANPTTCSKKDFYGNSYIYSKKDKKYRAKFKWKKFKSIKKVKN